MGNCKRCGAELPGGANFCPSCGRPVVAQRQQKKRGNGQGTILVTPGGRYKAVVTLGYYTDDKGKRHRKTRSQTFDKKKDAVAAIPRLQEDPRRELKKSMTFKQLYDAWLPTHRAGKSTMDGYRAAMKHFSPLWPLRIADIDVDDLQECLDDCPHGRRTRENMKALAGLLYKYGIPRHAVPENLNLGPFLIVSGDGAAHRESFSADQIRRIERARGAVPYAEEVYWMIYLGFRPSEFLALTAESYDKARQCIVGGAKTDAGRARVVTVSPKIRAAIEARAASEGPLCADPDGKPWGLKDFTESAFYPALEEIGIPNPMVEIGGGKLRHKYTPHSCRHTFATLLKRVAGADKDKQELIGHASPEMLRYYQDTPLDDLRAITDAL